MARIGVLSTPVPGHLNPMLALAAELQGRGHHITFFNMEDLRETVTAAGFDFVPVGLESHPLGSLSASKARLGTLSGLAAIRFTLAAVKGTTQMICRDGPGAVRAAKIDALVVDQMEPAGASVAQHLGLPYVTVANALTLNRDRRVPPALSPWRYREGTLAQWRNRIGYAVGDVFFAPILQTLNSYRKAWGLQAIRFADETFSTRAQISQLIPEFDFPRQELPPSFHYVGPLRRPGNNPVQFPYERLNGKPLIYASLGTLQGSKFAIFQTIAAACQGLDAQLVITHGGGLNAEQVRALPGTPLVVSYAPQLELLSRAALTITHAGLNTVLDSLSCGVPLVAMPITFEQPAIAERLRWCGGGEVLDLRRATPERLRQVVSTVLSDRRYRARAKVLQASFARAGGVKFAADTALDAMGLPRRVNGTAADSPELEAAHAACGEFGASHP